MKRIVLICLCAILVIGALPVYANDDMSRRGVDLEKQFEQEERAYREFKDRINVRWSYITVFSNHFDIKSGGKAECDSFFTTAKDREKLKISMYLKMYEDGVWKIVKYWSASEPNEDFCGLCEDWYVKKDRQYKMITYCYVYDGGTCVESSKYTSSSEFYD